MADLKRRSSKATKPKAVVTIFSKELVVLDEKSKVCLRERGGEERRQGGGGRGRERERERKRERERERFIHTCVHVHIVGNLWTSTFTYISICTH